MLSAHSSHFQHTYNELDNVKPHEAKWKYIFSTLKSANTSAMCANCSCIFSWPPSQWVCTTIKGVRTWKQTECCVINASIQCANYGHCGYANNTPKTWNWKSQMYSMCNLSVHNILTVGGKQPVFSGYGYNNFISKSPAKSELFVLSYAILALMVTVTLISIVTMHLQLHSSAYHNSLAVTSYIHSRQKQQHPQHIWHQRSVLSQWALHVLNHHHAHSNISKSDSQTV